MSECKWYIVHTASGSEKKVRDAIFEQAEKRNMSEFFEEVLIPSVESSEVRRGKKVLTEKKIMPGYIIVRMKMTNEAWHLVKAIPKVGAFLGGGAKPSPVSDAEVERIVSHISSGALSLSNVSYEVGKAVRVIDGPFESFSGVVEEVDLVKSRLRVSVSIFGRETPLDLGFDQVENV
jgi:transcriptional antiterminator NusG